MRRSLFFAVFFGMVVALLPTGAAAAEPCDKDFGARLKCWSTLAKAEIVPVTLDDEVPFDAKDPDRGAAEKTLRDHRENLVVEVPAGARTGGGGTALLLLAGTGWVAGDATIDDLPDAAREDLEKLSLCGETAPDDLEKLCNKLAAGPVKGQDLIEAADGAYRPPQSYPGSTDDESSYPDPLLIIVSTLLVALLTALVLVIRRSSRAAPRRTLATAGGGTVPTANSRAADEKTTHLRVDPAPRHGRRVGNVPGPARSALVRTELHPQGYVELDRVLYRAVWAEPGRPPPAPGGLVDVTDARERDSDVLYAFPPTTGRHAKGTRS
ncbi:hypothetical protein [Streptomyces sp. NBC_00038]|uniref:hypothetical protein n=1 Tax=Streptomyces sp. NBC_00038 TaxID=2903615 RepID=UPI002252789D|nr:hypothetical protein [Streptomyces sp. NBC_00038]MCX5560367.1 hypothetical protein [Streptomyces sp. NBC_00038]